MKTKRTAGNLSMIAESVEDYKIICELSSFFGTELRYHAVNKDYRVDLDRVEILSLMGGNDRY